MTRLRGWAVAARRLGQQKFRTSSKSYLCCSQEASELSSPAKSIPVLFGVEKMSQVYVRPDGIRRFSELFATFMASFPVCPVVAFCLIRKIPLSHTLSQPLGGGNEVSCFVRDVCLGRIDPGPPIRRRLLRQVVRSQRRMRSGLCTGTGLLPGTCSRVLPGTSSRLLPGTSSGSGLLPRTGTGLLPRTGTSLLPRTGTDLLRTCQEVRFVLEAACQDASQA